MYRLSSVIAACIGMSIGGCAQHAWTPASASSADDIVVVKAYEGPLIDGWNVAVVYGFDGFETGDAQWVCSVDGHDLQRTVMLQTRCANAVFLLPGDHVLGWRYHSRAVSNGIMLGHSDIVGSGNLHVHVEAGHTYRLLADGARKAVGLVPQFGRPDLLAYSSINPRFSNKPIDYAKSRSLEGAAK